MQNEIEVTGPKWFLPTIGIFLALFLAWGIGYLQARETEHRRQAPAAYARVAKQEAQRACRGPEPVAVFECVLDKVEMSKEGAQSEQELTAQQRSASAGMIAAVTAAFTLLVSIVGVFYVKGTLDATVRAVKDSTRGTEAMLHQNKLAEAGNRPWLKVDLKMFDDITFDSNGFIFPVEITITNIGNYPAQNCHFERGLEIRPADHKPLPLEEREVVLRARNALDGHRGETIFPGDHAVRRIAISTNQDVLDNALVERTKVLRGMYPHENEQIISQLTSGYHVTIVAAASYVSPLDDGRHVTAVVRDIIYEDPKFGNAAFNTHDVRHVPMGSIELSDPFLEPSSYVD